MRVAVSSRVIWRNSLGQFIAACSDAARETVEDAVEEGARLSKQFAPEGHKHDLRTIPLKSSIDSVVLSRTSGQWFATARHALPQEFGAVPHVIAGNPDLSFFWEEEGRWFVPASEFYGQEGLVTIVNHPGNPAQPYLRPAYDIVMGKVMDFAKRNYPG